MMEYPVEQRQFDNLASLLQSIEEKAKGNEKENKYLEAVETFLSYIQEDPKTMLQKLKDAKSREKRGELRVRTVRKAIHYLDNLAGREEVSMSEYAFRSAVIGDLIRMLSDYVARGI